MKEQAPPHLAFPFVCGFIVILLFGGLGAEDKGLRQSRSYYKRFLIGGLHQTEDTWWNEQQIAVTFTVITLDFFGKILKSVSSRQQRCVQNDWAYVEIWQQILVHVLYNGASLATIRHSVCIVTFNNKYLRHKHRCCPHTTLTTLMYLPWPSYRSKRLALYHQYSPIWILRQCDKAPHTLPSLYDTRLSPTAPSSRNYPSHCLKFKCLVQFPTHYTRDYITMNDYCNIVQWYCQGKNCITGAKSPQFQSLSTINPTWFDLPTRRMTGKLLRRPGRWHGRSACLPVCPSVCLSVCLSVCMSVRQRSQIRISVLFTLQHFDYHKSVLTWRREKTDCSLL